MRLSAVLSVVVLIAGLSPVRAHEFWLSPFEFMVSQTDKMKVGLRVGSGMKGMAMPYLPDETTRFEVVQGDQVRKVTSRMGDDPAMVMPAEIDGLAVVVHETADLRLSYSDFAVFQRFVEHKDFKTALADHAARGLPKTGFRETYRRYSKSLIAVGSGVGADRVMGLKIEIVALANPYTDDVSGGMPLLVLMDGAPRVDVQVELFQTAPDGSVSSTFHRTDANGRVTVPVRPGMVYLADSVALIALDNDDARAGPVWHSDWASLTFRTPD